MLYWFRLRLIFLCIFLPPVLYVFSIQGLEIYLQNRWTSELKAMLISDPAKLFEGAIRIESEIRENIHRFQNDKRLIRFGAETRIIVQTKTGMLLYPVSYEDLFSDSNRISSYWERFDNRDRISIHNVRLMRQGLQFSLNVMIPRNTWLANIVLVFYVFIFAAVLFLNYRLRDRMVRQKSLIQEKELATLREKLEAARFQVQDASGKEEQFQQEITKLRSELSMTSEMLHKTEDQALEEIEILEEKLRESIASRQEKETAVKSLQQEMEALKSAPKQLIGQKSKGFDWTMKRLGTLYKNLEFSERSVEGLLKLSQEVQLKAEVVFQHLDRSSDLVKVKRKVTIGKKISPVFETEFGNEGRIYWRKDNSAKTYILVIGTKNTQKKDLNFLSIN
jgi:hypothetical protein